MYLPLGSYSGSTTSDDRNKQLLKGFAKLQKIVTQCNDQWLGLAGSAPVIYKEERQLSNSLEEIQTLMEAGCRGDILAHAHVAICRLGEALRGDPALFPQGSAADPFAHAYLTYKEEYNILYRKADPQALKAFHFCLGLIKNRKQL